MRDRFRNAYRPGPEQRRTPADERLALTPLGPALPRVADGADWQAGVTPRHNRFRVYLNGEPIVSAFAASVAAGWVDVYRCDQDITEAVDDDPLSTRSRVQRRYGDVELRQTSVGA